MRKFIDNYSDSSPCNHPNYGKRWLNEELEKLASLVASGCTLRHICKELGRPASGVLPKLVQYRLIEDFDGEYHIRPQHEWLLAYRSVGTQVNVTVTKENPMASITPTLKTKHLINGRDVADMPTDDLIFEYVRLRAYWLSLPGTTQVKLGGVLHRHISKTAADVKFIEDLIEAR